MQSRLLIENYRFESCALHLLRGAGETVSRFATLAPCALLSMIVPNCEGWGTMAQDNGLMYRLGGIKLWSPFFILGVRNGTKSIR